MVDIMIKFQDITSTILCLLILSSLFLTFDGTCSELNRLNEKDKKAFPPRYIVNILVNIAFTALAANRDEEGESEDLDHDILVAAFIANSATPVLLFQNYHSITPFLKTIVFTGSALAVTELLAKQIKRDDQKLLLRMTNWFIIMPFIASKVNYHIHLQKIKNNQLNLNLLQPTYFVYECKIVPGIQLIELNW